MSEDQWLDKDICPECGSKLIRTEHKGKTFDYTTWSCINLLCSHAYGRAFIPDSVLVKKEAT